jgi:hypothetical protein
MVARLTRKTTMKAATTTAKMWAAAVTVRMRARAGIF